MISHDHRVHMIASKRLTKWHLGIHFLTYIQSVRPFQRWWIHLTHCKKIKGSMIAQWKLSHHVPTSVCWESFTSSVGASTCSSDLNDIWYIYIYLEQPVYVIDSGNVWMIPDVYCDDIDVFKVFLKWVRPPLNNYASITQMKHPNYTRVLQAVLRCQWWRAESTCWWWCCHQAAGLWHYLPKQWYI